MMMMIKSLLLVAVGAVSFALAAPAHADDQSYLDDLRAHGAPLKPWTQGEWVSEGHKMCNELRHGVSPANVAAEVTQTDPAMFMDVLQHQLCPDTLR